MQNKMSSWGNKYETERCFGIINLYMNIKIIRWFIEKKDVKVSEIICNAFRDRIGNLLIFKTDISKVEFKTVYLNRTTRYSVWPGKLPQVTKE